jgi:hypothetical protein
MHDANDADLPHVVWSGEFAFGGITMRCHVLDDGQRVIEEESVNAFLAWLEDCSPEDAKSFDEQFAMWVRGSQWCPQ